MSPQAASEGRQTRRPFTRADYTYLAQHYAHATAAACATALGRTVGSLRSFLHDHPELHKQGKV
ncbi:MAG: hypothetical protein EOO63_05180 [Hymenobacter sp.]|nr:MAG: hypothetical protein EOO63_05180 [Hymenobacter sp.]